MLLLSQKGSRLLSSQGNLQPGPAVKGTGHAGKDGPGQIDGPGPVCWECGQFLQTSPSPPGP